MSLKPDLVVGTNVPFHVMLRKPLEMAGVPLYLNMINSYEDVLKSIDDFGRFAGREKEAAAKRAQIEKEYASADAGRTEGQGTEGADYLRLAGQLQHVYQKELRR